MLKSSFSKVPKHSKFEYEPRYSEAKGEEGDESEEKRINFDRSKLPFSNSSVITGSLRRSSISYRKKETQKRKMRLYMLIGGLIIVLLILLQNL